MKELFLLLIAITVSISLVGCASGNVQNEDSTEQTSQTEEIELTSQIEISDDNSVSSVTEQGNNSNNIISGTQFVPWNDEVGDNTAYRYEGSEDVIAIPGGKITLSLPDGWQERVEVTWSELGYGGVDWAVYVTNRSILKSFQEARNVDYGYNYSDYIFAIFAHPKPYEHDPVYDETLNPVVWREDENYVYVIATASHHNPGHSIALMDQGSLKHEIGEEAYKALIGDLVVTEDEVLQMLSYTD